MTTFPNVYPISDSLKNFKIKVKLERVVTASDGTAPSFPAFLRQRTHDETSTGAAPSAPYPISRMEAESEAEEYIFSWQEKMFSRREFTLYSDESNCKTVFQKQYNKDIAEMKRTGNAPMKRLFSYIEGDEYESLEEKLENLTIKGIESNYLTEKMTTVRHRRVAPGRRGRQVIRTNLVIEAPSSEALKKARTTPIVAQTMYIMADLGTGDVETADPKDEHVLCVLKVINDDRLSLEPDFNFGVKKPYRIDSRVGVFQYTLEHVSVGLTLEDVEEEKKAEASLSEYRMGFLKARVGTDFDAPEEGVLKLFALCEIVEAKNFEYDGLFIHYLIELPKGWYSSSDQPLFGVTQLCKTTSINGDEVAYFSFPFENNLSFNLHSFDYDTGSLPEWPQLFIQVLSSDSWKRFRTEGYGYTTLPTSPGCCERTISTWRPTDGKPSSELRRYFIGGSPELEDFEFAAVPKNFDGAKLSKFGFQTVASGDVKLKFYTIHQCRSYITTERQQQLKYGALLERIGASVGLRSSIVSILESFQRARQRMIAVRENILADQGLFPI